MKRVLLLALVVCFGCSSKSPPPTSAKEFIAAFQSAFDNGQKEKLFDLVKWEGVPDDLRAKQEQILTIAIGEHKIYSFQLIPFDSDQLASHESQSIKLNIKPKYKYFAFHVSNVSDEYGPARGTSYGFVGVENGVFRICGVLSENTKPAVPAEPPLDTSPIGVELSHLPGVSIKRVNAEQGSIAVKPDGSLQARDTLMHILRVVYHGPLRRFRDEAELPTGMFDVSLPASFPADEDELVISNETRELSWKNLAQAYADAFDVVISPARREEDSYHLVTAEKAKLKLNQSLESENHGYATGGLGFKFKGHTMDDLAWWLERDQIVLNKTGLKGRFNFELPMSTYVDLDVDAFYVTAALRTAGLDIQRSRDEIDVILIKKAPRTNPE